MQSLIRLFIRYRAIVLIIFVVMLAVGAFALTRLDIEAYPDPSPPLVEIITQNPSWSAEEMEQQVTVPVETTLNGTPHLDQVRSISIFGLSDVKLYFSFDSDVLPRPSGSPQPPPDPAAAQQPAAAALAVVAHRRDLSLPAHRPRLHPQRDQGHAGLARPPRAQAGPRHHRHHHLRRHYAPVPGRNRPATSSSATASRSRRSSTPSNPLTPTPAATISSSAIRTSTSAPSARSTTPTTSAPSSSPKRTARPSPSRDVAKVS